MCHWYYLSERCHFSFYTCMKECYISHQLCKHPDHGIKTSPATCLNGIVDRLGDYRWDRCHTRDTRVCKPEPRHTNRTCVFNLYTICWSFLCFWAHRLFQQQPNEKKKPCVLFFLFFCFFTSFSIPLRLSWVTPTSVAYRVKVKCSLLLRRHGVYQSQLS